MAKTDKSDKKYEEKGLDPEKYEYAYKSDYEADWDVHRDYIDNFDAYEAMLLGYVWDSVSRQIDTSKITDSYAATLAIERAARVMGKLPEGETESGGKANAGKAALMDILRQKHIYPNANAQHPFKVKLRLWQLYSSIYGYMPMFYDWNVNNKGYVGPDCWLWNPRNLIPQQGRISIEDMDYVTALTWVSRNYLETQIEESLGKDELKKLNEDKAGTEDDEDEEDNDGWNKEALKVLLSKIDAKNTESEQSQRTVTEQSRDSQGNKSGIKLATRYEAGDDGEWITFAPDHGCVEVRRMKNPHKNGKIPFVIKYSLPLFDSFYGMGDFQRQKPLQFARDGVTNFYFKGIKMNLIPPIVANVNGVVKHTLDYREGAVMLENQPNSIRRLETSTAGLATYQAAMSALTGQQLSQVGSQNASIPGAEALNPSQGKTPQAIELYADKEATRDGQEREMLEVAIEQLTDGFFDLVVNVATEDFDISLYSQDIEDIHKAGLTDIVDMVKNFEPNVEKSSGNLKINPEKLKNTEYHFNINFGSTAKLSKERQRQSLADFVGIVGKFQNVLKEDPNTTINWTKIMQQYGNLADIPQAEEFITVKDGPSPMEMQLMEAMDQMKQEMLAMQQELMDSQQGAADVENRTVGGNTFNNPDIAEAAKTIESLGADPGVPQTGAM